MKLVVSKFFIFTHTRLSTEVHSPLPSPRPKTSSSCGISGVEYSLVKGVVVITSFGGLTFYDEPFFVTSSVNFLYGCFLAI